MNSKAGVDFRPFNKNQDYLAQRKLFSQSFPETVGTSVSTAEHYHWKFESKFSDYPAFEYVAEDTSNSEKKIVGYYAALPYKYKTGQAGHATCGMVCDVMTHPDYRGKGLFTGIGKFATNDLKEKKIDFVLGFPVRPEVLPGHLKVGWRVAFKMPMYLRLVGTESILPKKIRFMSKFLNPIISLLQFWTYSKNNNYQTEIVTVNEFLSAGNFSNFNKVWLSEQKNALVKSVEFLKWRTAAPRSQYFFITLMKDSNLVGYALVRPTILKGIESIAIIDFCVLKNHFSGCRKLHKKIYDFSKFLKKDVVVCMLSAKWVKHYSFRSAFYLPTPYVFSIIIKKLNSGLKDEELFSPDSWHLFWIDSDDL